MKFEEPTREQLISSLVKNANQMQGCMDAGCWFKKPGGQHTNGGCRCPNNREDERTTRMIYQILSRLIKLDTTAKSL